MKKEVKKAIISALEDSAVVENFAKAVEKKLLEMKQQSGSVEEEYVKRHVLFAAEGQHEDSRYMTANEVMDQLHEIAPDYKIRVRTLGKALLSDALEVKNTNKGRAYLVRGIALNPEELIDEAELEAAKEIDESEIEVNDAEEIDENELPKMSPDEAFSDSEKLAAVPNPLDEFESEEEYSEHLEELKRTDLISHINEYEMKISCEDKKKKKIIKDILSYVSDLDTADQSDIDDVAEESEESDIEIEEEAPKKKKKDKKKGKKDKKKKKKGKKSSD
tara:strand:+ start:17145 stop:17972 length:828 start_codon:yes stop_codon:yes gene_type:complete